MSLLHLSFSLYTGLSGDDGASFFKDSGVREKTGHHLLNLPWHDTLWLGVPGDLGRLYP